MAMRLGAGFSVFLGGTLSIAFFTHESPPTTGHAIAGVVAGTSALVVLLALLTVPSSAKGARQLLVVLIGGSAACVATLIDQKTAPAAGWWVLVLLLFGLPILLAASTLRRLEKAEAVQSPEVAGRVKTPLWLWVALGALVCLLIIGAKSGATPISSRGGSFSLTPPVRSQDGSFSLTPAAGWTSNSSYTFRDGTKPLLLMIGPTDSGIQAHLIVVQNTSYVEISALKEEWSTVVGMNPVNQFGPLEDTTLGGAQAVEAAYIVSNAEIEYLVVDHGDKTYLFAFSASGQQFHQLWSTDAHAMLTSVKWSAPS